MESSDRAWHVWVFAILAGLVLFLGALAFLVEPVVEARHEGIDAFTAICRALGITVGAPAAVRLASGPGETKVAWTAPEFAALAKADRHAGETVAQGTCVACHAADGSSADPAIPHLAGQSAFAILKELQDFKGGARTNDTMTALVGALSPKDMADVAAYYASLKRSDLDAAHPSFAGEDVETLVVDGDPARALPPCAACHGGESDGPIEAPSLTGQSAPYLSAQLDAFASNSRHNDVYSRMRAIAQKLTPRERTLLGAYYTTPH